MSRHGGRHHHHHHGGPSRRGFLTAAGSMAVAGVALKAPAATAAMVAPAEGGKEPFFGPHQGGIATPQQTYSYFLALDLVTPKRDEVVSLLKRWTEMAARLAQGDPAAPLADNSALPGTDSGEALGLGPFRLTLTFGLGAGLFTKDGHDRYGLAARRPAALVDLPHFPGDELVVGHSDGDLSVQACADDPQVAFHAVRQLARAAEGVAQARWSQAGSLPRPPGGKTPRNLMGFKDGTVNPSIRDPKVMDEVVWVGKEGPDWMQGGSYVVARRIRMALEHWDRMKLGFQEQTFGRQKYSGAPLGEKHELDPVDLNKTDADGNPVIPATAHVRLAAAATNGGAQILRRPYSYNEGVNFVAERWPPWRQGLEYDAGLHFICYQRDPRAGFIKIFDRLAKLDMLNQFTTHVSSAVFACPGGIAEGEFVGERLFRSA
jgi:deferrochelatase/peroxidase EfeB